MSNSEEAEDVAEAEGDTDIDTDVDADTADAIDPEDYVAFFDGDPAGDRIPSGPASRLYSTPDSGFDYSQGIGEATHLGERERTEFTIESLDGSTVKRYLFAEPATDEDMNQLIRSVMVSDRLQFCQLVVAEPERTNRVWKDDHTARERSMLYDHAFAWMRMSDFVTVSETVGD